MANEFLVARDVSYRYAVRRGVDPVQVLRRFSVSLTEGEFFVSSVRADAGRQPCST